MDINEIGLIFLVLSTIILFLHSLEGFSKEIQVAGKDTLKDWLFKATANRYTGFLLGAVFTGIVQSSSAVSALTVTLIDSGVVTLQKSLPVLLGANVGTATTALLASMKLSLQSRIAALANFGFNLTGAIIMVMVLPWFMMLLSQLTDKPHEAVAYAHLLMNVMVALMFLPFIDKVLKWLMARFNLVN